MSTSRSAGFHGKGLLDFKGHQYSEGISLLEFVAVVLVLSALAIYSLPRATDTGAFTLKSQAERLAGDLRTARFAALVGSEKLCVKLASDSYGIYIVNPIAGLDSCSSTPWQDPVTKSPVGFLFVNGVSIAATKGANAGSPLIFQTLGVPSVGTEYELTAGSSKVRVTVSEVTGHVAISQ